MQSFLHILLLLLARRNCLSFVVGPNTFHFKDTIKAAIPQSSELHHLGLRYNDTKMPFPKQFPKMPEKLTYFAALTWPT